MGDTDGNTVNRPAPGNAALALELILKEPSLELFCDSGGQPRIRLPPIRQHPTEEPWRIRSERVRAWIADFVWERSKDILQDREIDRILNILEGKAWRDLKRDLELFEAIEQDPVLEALIVLMHQFILFEGTMTKLMRQLVKVARKAGLNVRAKNWPKGTPQLSRRIGSFERFLTKAGITVERHRNSIERKIKLKMTVHDDPPSTPSPSSSVDKSHHPKSQRHRDASDSEKHAELFAQLSPPEERHDP